MFSKYKSWSLIMVLAILTVYGCASSDKINATDAEVENEKAETQDSGGTSSEKFNAFDEGIKDLLRDYQRRDALELYLSEQEQAYEYAEQICAHFGAGNTDRNFNGFEYGRVISYSLTETEIQYYSALEVSSVVFVCPEFRANSPYNDSLLD